MKLLLTQAVDLASLSGKLKTLNLPLKATYHLIHILKIAAEESQFYSTQLNTIIDKYAEKDENGAPVPLDNGNGVKLKPEFIAEAQAEVNELMNFGVDFPDYKFRLSDFEASNLSFDELNVLFPFLEE